MRHPRPEISIDIGTLALEGLGRAYGQRAAASFERALPGALDQHQSPVIRDDPGPIRMPNPGRRSPEAFGRDLAERVAKALLR